MCALLMSGCYAHRTWVVQPTDANLTNAGCPNEKSGCRLCLSDGSFVDVNGLEFENDLLSGDLQENKGGFVSEEVDGFSVSRDAVIGVVRGERAFGLRTDIDIVYGTNCREAADSQ